MAWVTELGTNNKYEYGLPADKAVVCAYYQHELGNFNTWIYDFSLAKKVGHFWNCGNMCCMCEGSI